MDIEGRGALLYAQWTQGNRGRPRTVDLRSSVYSGIVPDPRRTTATVFWLGF